MTWADLPDDTDFTPANLAFGVVDDCVAVRIGDDALPVREVVREGDAHLFEDPSLDRFLDAGPDVWRATRERIAEHLEDPRRARRLLSVHDARVRLPFTVADYVDFYSS